MFIVLSGLSISNCIALSLSIILKFLDIYPLFFLVRTSIPLFLARLPSILNCASSNLYSFLRDCNVKSSQWLSTTTLTSVVRFLSKCCIFKGSFGPEFNPLRFEQEILSLDALFILIYLILRVYLLFYWPFGFTSGCLEYNVISIWLKKTNKLFTKVGGEGLSEFDLFALLTNFEIREKVTFILRRGKGGGGYSNATIGQTKVFF